MTVTLTGVANDGLMDVQGKAFFALDTLNTVRLTTVPTEVIDVIEEFENFTVTLDLQQTIEGLPTATSTWQSGGSTLSNKLRDVSRDIMVQLVQEDSPEPASDLTSTLNYLINQMEVEGEFVDANAVTLSLAANDENDANIGDPAITFTARRGDGRVQQNALAEDIQFVVTSDASANAPGFSVDGEVAVDTLSQEWPKGSSLSTTITASNAASSLLTNGDFEITTISNTPDDWIVTTGTPGITVLVTDAEVQTVVIAESPTGGSYLLYYTNTASIVRATVPLAWNAGGSAVQSALRDLPGLEGVTVDTTGTSPNFTHTITFTGVAGNAEQLTSKNSLEGGLGATITHATTVVGNVGSYKGRALQLNGNGSEETELYHALTLSPEVVYCCHFRTRRGTSPDESSSSSSSATSSSGTSSSSSATSSATSSSSSATSSSSVTSSSSSSATSSSSSSATSSSSSSATSSSGTSSSSETSSSSATSSSSSATSSATSSSSSDVGTVHIGPANSGIFPATVLGDYTSIGDFNGRTQYSNGVYDLSWISANTSWELAATGTAGSPVGAFWEQPGSLDGQAVDAELYNPGGGSGAEGVCWAAINPSDESSSYSSSSQTSSSASSSSSATSSSSAGEPEIRVEIVDGIEGTITNDKEGNVNQKKITVASISTTDHDSQFFFFRMTRQHSMPVYLRIRAATPIADGTSVYIDEMAVVAATELYNGGPFVAIFAGATPAVIEDAWTLTVTNDRGGQIQEWYERAFDMRSKGFLLPTSGVTLIPDSVIS